MAGGIGTIVFSVLGALMIAGGVMLAFSRRKA
ncbi:LPXTG cell wall anchor domain-containing protein [Bifidobacterium bifidum]